MKRSITLLLLLLLNLKAFAIIIVAFPTSIPNKCYVAIYDDFYNPIMAGVIDCGGINPNDDFIQFKEINQKSKLVLEWKKKYPESKFKKALLRNASKAEIEKYQLAVENIYQEISNNSEGHEAINSSNEFKLEDFLVDNIEPEDIMVSKALDPFNTGSVINTFSCNELGYRIELIQPAGSQGTTGHIIRVLSTNISYFASPSQVPSGSSLINSVEIFSGQGQSNYCDLSGNPITGPVMSVTESNPNSWEGLTDILHNSNLTALTMLQLVSVYNQYKLGQNSPSLPSSCGVKCVNPGVYQGGGQDDDNDFEPGATIGEDGITYDLSDLNPAVPNPIGGGNTGNDVSSQWDTFHILNTIYLGIGINSFKENINGRNFTNSDLGVYFGFYKPFVKKKRFSFGLTASGAYYAVNNDFGEIDNFISYMDAIATSSSTQGTQTLLQIGLGPQANILAFKKFLLSSAVQGGYFSFNQDAISINQQVTTDRTTFSKEIFSQDDINEGDIFVKPTLKIGYSLSKNLSIWAEGSYLIANSRTIQNSIIPNGSALEGEYFWDQIITADSYKTEEKEINLNTFSINFGVAVGFGRKPKYSGTGHVDVFKGRNPQTGVDNTQEFKKAQANIQEEQSIIENAIKVIEKEIVAENLAYNNNLGEAILGVHYDKVNADVTGTIWLEDAREMIYTGNKSLELLDAINVLKPLSSDLCASPCVRCGYGCLCPVDVASKQLIIRIDTSNIVNGNQLKYDHNTSRQYAMAYHGKPKNSIGIDNNSTGSDVESAWETTSGKKNSNPYFVSNELEGSMELLQTGQSGNTSTTSLDRPFKISKVKEVKKESDLKNRNYVLIKNGKRYFYKASNKKIEKMLFEARTIKKASDNIVCPPIGMEGEDCSIAFNFCWCKLKYDRDK